MTKVLGRHHDLAGRLRDRAERRAGGRPRRGRRTAPLLGVRRAVELRRAGSRRADRRGQAVSGRDDGARRRRDRRPGRLRRGGGVGCEEPVAGAVLHPHAPAAGRAGGRRFSFVDGLDEAVSRAREAAGDKDVMIMGGADMIRQALGAGHVDELTIIDRAGRAGCRQAPVRGLRSVDGPRAHARAPVAVRDAHHVSRPALTSDVAAALGADRRGPDVLVHVEDIVRVPAPFELASRASCPER